MKLKKLKEILNKMTPAELEQELLYNSKQHSISGVVSKVVKATSDRYWDGEDDPSEILTRKEWKERGYTNEEIEEMDVEIPKGSWVVEL